MFTAICYLNFWVAKGSSVQMVSAFSLSLSLPPSFSRSSQTQPISQLHPQAAPLLPWPWKGQGQVKCYRDYMWLAKKQKLSSSSLQKNFADPCTIPWGSLFTYDTGIASAQFLSQDSGGIKPDVYGSKVWLTHQQLNTSIVSPPSGSLCLSPAGWRADYTGSDAARMCSALPVTTAPNLTTIPRKASFIEFHISGSGEVHPRRCRLWPHFHLSGSFSLCGSVLLLHVSLTKNQKDPLMLSTASHLPQLQLVTSRELPLIYGTLHADVTCKLQTALADFQAWWKILMPEFRLPFGLGVCWLLRHFSN